MDNETPRLLRTVEEIKRGNERRAAETPKETKEEIGSRAITLMIFSASESAS